MTMTGFKQVERNDDFRIFVDGVGFHYFGFHKILEYTSKNIDCNTRRKDKNGTTIYTGDTIKYEYYSKKGEKIEAVGEVSKTQYASIYEVTHEKGGHSLCSSDLYNIEVIGNKYEKLEEEDSKLQIKTRCWFGKNTHLGMRYYNSLQQIDESCTGFDHLAEMICSGLEDANGKEIYQSDIVKLAFPTEFVVREVFFRDGAFFAGQTPLYFFNSKNTVIRFTVIGNIYENPELKDLITK